MSLAVCMGGVVKTYIHTAMRGNALLRAGAENAHLSLCMGGVVCVVIHSVLYRKTLPSASSALIIVTAVPLRSAAYIQGVVRAGKVYGVLVDDVVMDVLFVPQILGGGVCACVRACVCVFLLALPVLTG